LPVAAALREANEATAAARAAAAAAQAATARAEELMQQLQCLSPPASARGRARSSLSLGELRPLTADGALEEAPSRARCLPRRIFVLRHGESEGNVDESLYSRVADPEISLTERGVAQAEDAGRHIRARCEADGGAYRVFFYFSPYMRTKQVRESRPTALRCMHLRGPPERCTPVPQTCAAVMAQFDPARVSGVREEPQLREQDFGNYQDVSEKQREKAERESYGRFFYRFPNGGESGADVYDRLTVFEDHLVRDVDAGRFTEDTSIVIVTHGLSLRIFLMRWNHWTVADYEECVGWPGCSAV